MKSYLNDALLRARNTPKLLKNKLSANSKPAQNGKTVQSAVVKHGATAKRRSQILGTHTADRTLFWSGI